MRDGMGQHYAHYDADAGSDSGRRSASDKADTGRASGIHARDSETARDAREDTMITTVDFLREQMLSLLSRSERLGEVRHGFMEQEQELELGKALKCVDRFVPQTPEEAKRFVLEFCASDVQKGYDWERHPWTTDNDYGPSSAEDLINSMIADKINKDALLRELAGPDAIYTLCKRLFDRYRLLIQEKIKVEHEMSNPATVTVDYTDESSTGFDSHHEYKDNEESSSASPASVSIDADPRVAPHEWDWMEDDSDHYDTMHDDETVMINNIIAQVARYGTRNTIDEMFSMVEDVEYVTKHIAFACSQIDAGYAADKMLARLASSESKERAESSAHERSVRADLSRILYRLEFGRVGISEQGLSYLGRVYDLGAHNNPDFFARRLTATGDMGIFDEEKKLQKYINLGDVSDGQKLVQATVLDFTLEQFFSRPAEAGSPERTQQEHLLSEFKHKYFDFLEAEFFSGTDIQFNNLSFREQAWFMKFVLNAKPDTQNRTHALARDHGEAALKLFISMEMDRRAGEKILDLYESLSKAQMAALIHRYGEALYQAEYLSANMDTAFGADTGFKAEDIFEGLMVRAKDVLATTHTKISHGYDADMTVRNAVEDMAMESSKERVLSGQFRKLAEVLRDKPVASVDIRQYMAAQEVVATQSSALYTRALHERGELKPIPEIHWRVDRGLDEYTRRFGFDVVELLDELAESDRKKVLLEFGPGSGKSKAERAQRGCGEHYMDIAMADTVYYPLSGLIRNMIDWRAVNELMGAELAEKDKDALADVLYKTLMIEDGQTARDDFAYCHTRVEALNTDPVAITELLAHIAPQLSEIERIPTTISTRDHAGNVVYPYKIDVSATGGQSAEFLVAKEMLSRNMETCVRHEEAGAVFEAIPAHPEGMIVGDFGEINTLRDEQIDVAIGVRSTVYLRGDEYVDFMMTMTEKLAQGGCMWTTMCATMMAGTIVSRS